MGIVTEPWFLSIVSGLLVTVIAYFYFSRQSEEKRPTNLQYGVIFFIIALLVYGSILIAMCSFGHGSISTGGGNCADNTKIFTGIPNFNK